MSKRSCDRKIFGNCQRRQLIHRWGCSLLFATTRAPFIAFFYKTRANSQQVLPVQTGLYRYDEWMVQDINEKNLNVSSQNLTEVN